MQMLQDDKWEAMYQLISIIPSISTDSYIDLCQGRFGPFKAHVPMKLPLWAALQMEEQGECTIEIPKWMEEEQLKAISAEEKANLREFAKVPRHYTETAFALLQRPKVFGGKEKYRQRILLLLKDLIELRKNKILAGLKGFDANDQEIQVTNMSAAELSCFRTRSVVWLDSMNELLKNQALELNEEVLDDSMLIAEDSSSRP